ncbi:v-type proton ATPase subunit C 1 [Caerostris extrusa]|uniref:V-type proton ATPase subunit C n=1 Tax=Caerostris extrusa TaxID=172846 RepID=A0AAV4QD27_CAEEX|nr:v-type proton ATPase subunit C 1 [Caerostris extrusa]
MKVHISDYRQLDRNLENIEKQHTGSLWTRSLAGIVKKEHFVLNSEYLITLLVIVPKNLEKLWLETYQTMSDMVAEEVLDSDFEFREKQIEEEKDIEKNSPKPQESATCRPSEVDKGQFYCRILVLDPHQSDESFRGIHPPVWSHVQLPGYSSCAFEKQVPTSNLLNEKYKNLDSAGIRQIQRCARSISAHMAVTEYFPYVFLKLNLIFHLKKNMSDE